MTVTIWFLNVLNIYIFQGAEDCGNRNLWDSRKHLPTAYCVVHCRKRWHLRLLMHPCTITLICVVYTEKCADIYSELLFFFNHSEYDNHNLDYGRHTALPRDSTKCSRFYSHQLGWFHWVYSNVIFSWFMSRRCAWKWISWNQIRTSWQRSMINGLHRAPSLWYFSPYP